MIQPELGRKLSEIRKQKGFTQEELVAKCNVTVRTLQRIESGDVTPRPTTLRLLIEAMDYDWSSFSEEEQAAKPVTFKSKLLLIDVDPLTASTQLQWAWLAGILYFILGFPESLLDYKIISSELLMAGKAGYVVIKLGVMISFLFMMRGFILLGNMRKNTLLTLSAWIYLLVLVIDYSIDLISLPFGLGDLEAVLIGKAIMYGFTSLFFGFALVRSESDLGQSAKFAGMFEMLAGITFLTVFLSMIGLIVLIPAELLEIYILYKFWEKMKAA